MKLTNGDRSSTCDAYFASDDEHDLYAAHESKGAAHFIKKWEGDKDQSYLKIVEPKNELKTEYTKENEQEWITVLIIDCRGVEPTHWMPRNDFTIETESGETYEDEDVDFEEAGDGQGFIWADVNDAGQEVSISNLEYSLEAC
uniref:DUF866 domain-containing protein n=1 Tax=Octactis speculum TaxID=3111310 RepID=A0A7S2GCS6_9STRA|mmetsp:Transcript_42988/g.58682  ORF Transcript_42988/g.58682 Transcript_42988/m.58682 type:complete len:143 (+) Transcript_42988:1-429(+)